MIPNPTLISALRRVADTIENVPNYSIHQQVAPPTNSDFYCHDMADTCNCGWLARSLGIKPQKLFGMAYYGKNATDYFHGLEVQCDIAERPVIEVFAFLVSAGLEKGDFSELEYLKNEVVLDRAGIKAINKHYSEPANVARYFRAQADLLEEQLTSPPPLCPPLTLAAQAWPVVALPQAEKVGVV